MAHLRGWLDDGTSVFGVVSHKRRWSGTAYTMVEHLMPSLEDEGRREPRKAIVPGALAAIRFDGLIDMGEGMTDDGIERVAIVVAETFQSLWIVTIRTRPQDDNGSAVDRILASFSIDAAAAADR